MEKYIKIKNFGKGFITHDDQEKDGLQFRCFPGDIVKVIGEEDAIIIWKARVNGIEILENTANVIIEQKFNERKTLDITEKTKELKDLKDKVYDFSDCTIC